MGDIKQKFGPSGQSITITLAGLANNAARESTAIDNRENLFEDALVQLVIKTGASGTSSVGYINVYAYGTVDDGVVYSDGMTGVDAPATLTNPPNVRLIGVINAVANATVYRSHPMSVAGAFGGVLPARWGIVVENRCGAPLDSSESNFSKKYQGVYGVYG